MKIIEYEGKYKLNIVFLRCDIVIEPVVVISFVMAGNKPLCCCVKKNAGALSFNVAALGYQPIDHHNTYPWGLYVGYSN